MKKLFGVVAVAMILSACGDWFDNSDVYSCETRAEGHDEHLCYESTEEDFMDCREDENMHTSYKYIYTPGRGCPNGALRVCDAELVPGHPYTVYVYSKDIADMGCRRVVPF